MSPEEARGLLARLGSNLEPSPGRVHVEVGGPVARIVIDNPRYRNAITLAMMVELADAVETLRTWDGAAVVVRSAEGGVFCSGGHLDEVRRAVSGPEQAHAMARAMTVVLDGLLDLPVISVSVLDGPAIGGGAELATATDFRVASPAAAIRFVHARLGIAPGWGGAGRLVGHLGSRQALRILARADRIEASEALGVGLFDAVGPDADEAAEEWLAPMLEHHPSAIRAVKSQVRAAGRGDRLAEAEAFSRVWGRAPHQAALSALRKPK